MSDLKSRSMAAKRTPLERSLRQKMLGQSQQSEPIHPRRMVQQAPLSFAQQRLWFLAQLEPRSPAYNILSATQIEGPLDTAALERSLTEMSRRHETRSEEHTSELQSLAYLVCRLLLEKKK